MGMAWPWRRRALPRLLDGWRAVTWLGLVPPPRLTASEGPPPTAGAADARTREADGFEAFFLRYERQITGYLWRLTGDEQVASELAQETFLRAWQHFAAVREYDRPLAWLFRVATNLARQQHRRRRVVLERPTAFGGESDPAASDPSLRIAEQELVRQTLLELSLQQRAALILHEVYGLSCAEVGQLLHVSRDAVKMALWRGREQFRVRYLREDEEAP